MGALEWGTMPQHESGIDRGVLYPLSGEGVVWNGLIGVDETSDGVEVETFLFDGIAFLNVRSSKIFSAKLQAFSAPSEFDACCGFRSIVPGFVLTRQERVAFGLSYRTNATDGYKIHLIYNAVATPEGSKSYSTVTSTATPIVKSWNIDAVPPLANGFKPTAHFVIDSNKTDDFQMKLIEDILYGANSEPRLPEISELINLMIMRFVIILATPESPLPPNAKDGDLVFVQSNEVVYSIGEPSDSVRPVIVMSGNNTNLLPDLVYPGDLVYDKLSGVLYQIGV